MVKQLQNSCIYLVKNIQGIDKLTLLKVFSFENSITIHILYPKVFIINTNVKHNLQVDFKFEVCMVKG